ncbi:MAG: deaminase [Alphaproteobacteria bacterium]
MNNIHFDLMAKALAIEEQSEHPTHKVGALLHGKNSNNQSFTTTHPNFWPAPLKQTIGQDKKLGNASTTMHAEIATLCNSHITQDATLYITDLPCPNCAKMVAEARIKALYIDSHTHNTPLGEKIKPYFDNISLPVLNHAGITVVEMNAQTREFHILSDNKNASLLRVHRPLTHTAIEQKHITPESFEKHIENQRNSDTHFAACYAKTTLGQYVFLSAQPHRSIGLTKELEEHIKQINSKYEARLQPINRLLMACARYGLKIIPEFLYSSRVPTSREFVNMIGAGYTQLKIGNASECRDEWGMKAFIQLQENKVVDFHTS